MKQLTEKQAWIWISKHIEKDETDFVCHMIRRMVNRRQVSNELAGNMTATVKSYLSKHCDDHNIFTLINKYGICDIVPLGWRADWCKEQAKNCGGK